MSARQKEGPQKKQGTSRTRGIRTRAGKTNRDIYVKNAQTLIQDDPETTTQAISTSSIQQPVYKTADFRQAGNPLDIEKRRREVRDMKSARITGFMFNLDDRRPVGCKITNASIEEKSGCILDPQMGPSSATGTKCQTCGKGFTKCHGHFGYIELYFKVLHPAFTDNKSNIVSKLMTMFCFQHYQDTREDYRRFKTEKLLEIRKLINEDDRIPNVEKELAIRKAEADMEADLPRLAKEAGKGIVIQPCFNLMDVNATNRYSTNARGLKRFQLIYNQTKTKKCPKCPKRTYHENDGIVSFTIDKENKTGDDIDPADIYEFFKAIDDDPDNEWANMLGFEGNKFSALVMQYVKVLPNIFRPQTILSEGKVQVSKLSEKYSTIVAINEGLRQVRTLSFAQLKSSNEQININIPKGRQNKQGGATTPWKLYKDLNENLKALFWDAGTDFEENDGFKSMQPVMSFRVFLDGKTGEFRGNILGKRSDFGGRTVIIGDPLIDVDEVGMTESFAERVSIPERVENESQAEYWNSLMPVEQSDGTFSETIILRVERRGRPYKIDNNNPIQIIVGDTVRRKLVNGDVVVLTRQPVLHKGSMMAFKVRIQKRGTGNVIRINPAVTTPFNADFDGDEMNFSVPQDIYTRNEVIQTMLVTNCLRGDSSTPWIGLIQNGIVGAFQMTQPNRVVSKTIYGRAIASYYETVQKRNPDGIFRTIDEVPDHIEHCKSIGVNPYSGRALFSFFLPRNLRYTRFVKRGEVVEIEEGILISGIMTKADLGRTPNGIIDTILERYGPETTIVFLSAVQRGLTVWLEASGQSMGISDCVLEKENNKDPQEIINAFITEARKDVERLSQIKTNTETEKKVIENNIVNVINQLRDKIIRIVRAGGADIAAIHKFLNDEHNEEVIEALRLAAKGNEDINKLADTLAVKRNAAKVQNLVYLKEVEILSAAKNNLVETAVNEIPPSKFSFLRGQKLKDFYIGKLQSQIDNRKILIGADKFTNSLLEIVYSGGKGSEMNIVSMLGALGQQEEDGKRLFGKLKAPLPDELDENINVRDYVGGRVLPHVDPGSGDPTVHGYCSSSLGKGLTPVEFYQYATATRTNVVEANLKPPDTGSFYRSAYSLMEDIVTYPDGSVRDENGRIVQFAYGTDFFDGRKLIKVGDSAQFVNIRQAVNKIRSESDRLDFGFQ